MQRTVPVVIALAGALVLAGCSTAAPAAAPVVPSPPVASSVPTNPKPTAFGDASGLDAALQEALAMPEHQPNESKKILSIAKLLIGSVESDPRIPAVDVAAYRQTLSGIELGELASRPNTVQDRIALIEVATQIKAALG